MKKITLIKKIREIINKHNEEYRYQGIATLAPAKEIADYVFKNFTTTTGSYLLRL